MKKFLIVLALASVSLTSMAQDEEPTLKYSVATNSFWSNWFVQANFAYSAFYSNEEKHESFDKSPLKDFRRGLGFSVAIGKWFTPGIGLRTKFNAMDGTSVITTDADKNKIKYWNLQEQALLNLSNLLCGYNPDRVWNFIPYFGVGAARNCSYNTWELGISAGIQNSWRLSDKFRLNLDLGYNICGDDFEGEGNVWGGHNQKNHDHWFTAEVGLTYNLGKTNWDPVPDVDAIKQLSQAQLDALNAQLADANAEIERLRNQPAPEPVETIVTQSVKDFITTPISVFFNLNKTEIAVLKDLVNVKALAKFAIENDRSILVTGYADSATGKPDHNQWLSDERAKTVVEELVGMGVNRSNITAVGKGGVDILSPFELNRRATVEVR